MWADGKEAEDSGQGGAITGEREREREEGSKDGVGEGMEREEGERRGEDG